MISVVVPCLGVSHSWKGVWPGTATAQQPVVLSPPNVRVVTGQLPPEQTAWSPVIPGGGVGFRPFEAGGAFLGGVQLRCILCPCDCDTSLSQLIQGQVVQSVWSDWEHAMMDVKILIDKLIV